MLAAPIDKIRQVFELTPEEERAVEGLAAETVQVPPGEMLEAQGEKPSHSLVLLHGATVSRTATADGREQILELGLPGDWIDLHSYFIQTMDFSIVALTESRLAKIPHPRIRDLIDRHPRLTEALWRDTLVTGAIMRQWITNLGVRDTRSRLAHLSCELYERMSMVGRADAEGFTLNLSQQNLAEILGASTVHINRSLQDLRADGLLQVQRGRFTSANWQRLAVFCEFDPTYLHRHEGLETRRREGG